MLCSLVLTISRKVAQLIVMNSLFAVYLCCVIIATRCLALNSLRVHSRGPSLRLKRIIQSNPCKSYTSICKMSSVEDTNIVSVEPNSSIGEKLSRSLKIVYKFSRPHTIKVHDILFSWLVDYLLNFTCIIFSIVAENNRAPFLRR